MRSKTVCGFATALVMVTGCMVDNADFDPSVAWPPATQDGAASPPADGGSGQDSRAKKSAPFSCTPGAFIACQTSDVLQRCGVKGKGVEKVDCSHGCNATTKKCNQCDSSQPAQCVNDALVSCSASGELSKESCKYGCATGKCKDCEKKVFFKDADADGYGDSLESKWACEKPEGYSINAKDCDDDLVEVRPGQTSYFKDPIVGTKSFDYNCDNTHELQYPLATFGSCARKGSICLGSGWLLLVPPCGGSGIYMDCKPKGNKPKDGCSEIVLGGVQHCR